MRPDDALVFSVARFATMMGAQRRFAEAHGIDLRSPAGRAAARAAYYAENYLVGEQLSRICGTAVANAIGTSVGSQSLTLWPSLTRTYEGAAIAMGWEAFGRWHRELGAALAPKGSGLVYNATTTSNGHRADASTITMHALILDADGSGDWFVLHQALVSFQLAFILHRSGGHTSAAPRWRAIIPFSAPVDTSGAPLAAAWRGAYDTCRTVFGALACLSGPGFDPATGAPSHAWYPGSRRTYDAPPREVICRHGATLDLPALLSRLPASTVKAREVQGWLAPVESPSLLELAFEEAGMLGRAIGKGRFAVRCPWNSMHSDPLGDGEEATSSTILFPASSAGNIGGFLCSHSACGSRHVDAVLAALPLAAVRRARIRHRPGLGSWGSGFGRLPGLRTSFPRYWSDDW